MNHTATKISARRARRRDGMALVFVLMVIAVLSLLGVAGTRSAQTELQMGGKAAYGITAGQLATGLDVIELLRDARKGGSGDRGG